MAEDSVLRLGYLGIVVASFLSATLLPLSSEAFVALAVAGGYQPWLVVLCATAGNSLGALANYVLGKYAANFVLSRYLRVDPATRLKGEQFYRRWGAPALFFSWLPGIGDPLTVIGGALRVHLAVFIFWVLIGRFLRYLVVLGVVSAVFTSS